MDFTSELPKILNLLITQPCCCTSAGVSPFKRGSRLHNRNKSRKMSIWLNSWVFLSQDWKRHQQHSITLVVLTEGQKSFGDCVCAKEKQTHEGSERETETVCAKREDGSLWWSHVCLCARLRKEQRKDWCMNVCFVTESIWERLGLSTFLHFTLEYLCAALWLLH